MWGWWRSKKRRPDLHLVLFTRAGCHLCDTAHEQLVRWQRQYRFSLELKDIATSEELTQAYGNCIPVVTVNGKVRFRGKVNDVLFQRLMTAPPRERTNETPTCPKRAQ